MVNQRRIEGVVKIGIVFLRGQILWLVCNSFSRVITIRLLLLSKVFNSRIYLTSDVSKTTFAPTGGSQVKQSVSNVSSRKMRRTMDTSWNLRCLFALFFWIFFVFHNVKAETFINEQTSFLQLKKWDSSESRGLGFRFKTFLSDALLLYMDDEGKSNFLRVELFQGKLRLTCSYGARFGAMAVEIGDNLNDLLWHRVLLERSRGKTTISLDSQSKSTVNSHENTNLHIESSMYFGGIPTARLAVNSVTQPSVLLLHRFVGCITDIDMFEYSARQGKRRNAVVEDSKDIIPGCTDMCQIDNKCQNNGMCLNRFTTSECDCTATGFSGKTCKEGNGNLH